MKRNLNLQSAAPGLIGRAIGAAWLRGFAAVGPLVWLVALIVNLWTPAPARAEDAMPLDYQVKAAFLVNFPKYVDWPAESFPATNSPIVVGIFGDDNVANEFATMIENGRTVGGRPVKLKRINREDQIGTDCHVLFISTAERQRIPSILQKVKGTGVLTVSDNEGEDFLAQGGVINLVHRDRKIRLQVNLTAASQAHLKISSRLLVVADEVRGK
jgi:hypothetical protein